MATVLKRGSKGAAVRELQATLNAVHLKIGTEGPPLTVDGMFGGSTERRLCAFQERAQLVVDGIYGAQSRVALTQALAPAKPAKPEPDKSAMSKPASATGQGGKAKAPPNEYTLKLLDTARPIDEIIIHCAATPEGKDFTVDDIRAWHKQRGWTDVGYHYVVYRDGRVMLGRPVGQVGSHVAGHNTGTIGIVYIGGVSADGKRPKDTRTPFQRSSLLWLTGQLAAKHKVRKVTGHNQYAQKACPSFDVRRDALGALA